MITIFGNEIVFFNKASFCLNGKVNRRNCQYWSIDNLHYIQETFTQHPQKINLWAAIFTNLVIDPVFIPQCRNMNTF